MCVCVCVCLCTCMWTNLVPSLRGHGWQSIYVIQWLKWWQHWIGTNCPCQSPLHTSGDQNFFLGTVMVNFRCQFDWIRGCPARWLNVISACVQEGVYRWDKHWNHRLSKQIILHRVVGQHLICSSLNQNKKPEEGGMCLFFPASWFELGYLFSSSPALRLAFKSSAPLVLRSLDSDPIISLASTSNSGANWLWKAARSCLHIL